MKKLIVGFGNFANAPQNDTTINRNQEFFPLLFVTLVVKRTKYDLPSRNECVLNHPPYSPDLSPCDHFLFPKLKLPSKGRLFEDVQDIQGAVTSTLRAIPQEDLQRSFQSLLDHATRCIDAEGMYFE